MPSINTKYAMNLVGIANHMLASEGANFYFKKVPVSEAIHDNEVPPNDFVVGDSVEVVNAKEGEIEVLHGTVIEVGLNDDNGWYNRVECNGRKFKVPFISNTQRLGTLVRRCV